jgi:hypothetical protein
MAKDKAKQEEVLTGTQGAKLVGEGVFKLGEAIAGEIKRGVTQLPGNRPAANPQNLHLFAEGVGKVLESVTGAITYGVKKAVTDPFGNSREDSLTASKGVKLFADGLTTMARAVNGDKTPAPIPPPQITNVRFNPESTTYDPKKGYQGVAPAVESAPKTPAPIPPPQITNQWFNPETTTYDPKKGYQGVPPRASLKLDSNQTPPPQASGQNQQQSQGGH